jgi:colanic acid biosynthesis glycosyl transferase WcaI
MRILMLSQWFAPEPFFKGLPFAKELAARGHDVEVLTGFPNYPGGKVYDGYRLHLYQREIMYGIRVNRVALYPSHDRSSIKRALNYISFAISASLIGPFIVKKPDVIYVYHPPATVGLAAIVLKWFKRVPFVYDIQDLWPDTLEITDMVRNNYVILLVDKWCNFVYRQAAKIVVLSPGFRMKLLERGVDENKVEVIYNWCDEDNIACGEKDQELATDLGLADSFNVMFAGNIGKGQGLESVLEAAAIIGNEIPGVRFVFVGSGVELSCLMKKAEQMAIRNISFLGQHDIEQMGKILNIADVLLVHLRDEPLFRITVPSKTQAYLCAGKPILMAVKGDAAAIIEEAGAGITCAPGDANALAAAVKELYCTPPSRLEEMGNRGRSYYHQNMSKSASVRKFEIGLAGAVKKQEYPPGG